MKKLLALLKVMARWPELPASLVRTCVVCRRTDESDSDISWDYDNASDGSRAGTWGLCSDCNSKRICGLGEQLIVMELTGERWRPRRRCPCPICEASRRRA